jgi:hypothetical protein
MDFNDVFPLHIAGFEDKTTGSINAAKQIEAKVATEHKETAKALLFQLNKSNQSQQQLLRAAYAVYTAAPCETLEIFIDAVKHAREFEARLTHVDLVMQNIITIISKPAAARVLGGAGANGEEMVTRLLLRAIDTMHAPSYMPRVIAELESVRVNSQEWLSEPEP